MRVVLQAQINKTDRDDARDLAQNPMMEGPLCRFQREARARELHRHCRGG